MNNKQQLAICWLRRDLRLYDNTALHQALQSGLPVLAVFIFDKKILNELAAKEDKRVVFIHRTLKEIETELNKLGSSLLVLHDTPLEAFKKITDRFQVLKVFTNRDYEPYAITRDQDIEKFLKSKNIELLSFKDQVIFEKSEVVKPDGSPYQVFTSYANKWKELYFQNPQHVVAGKKGHENWFQTKPFEFPSLTQLGFKEMQFQLPVINLNKEALADYKNTRNIPSVEGTSFLSMYLRFGIKSIREVVAKAAEINVTFLNELIWREFFMMILYHYPNVVSENFKTRFNGIQWRNNEKEFALWCKGETGYPLVDAGMRQLNEIGWMHNRIRMITAGFLCKHLLIDWRWGEAYFAEKLLDYELSSNNGNWQWAAGTGCDASPYFRIFNPSEQIKKFDPKLEYVKKWVPDFVPGYLPEIVAHPYARNRALDVYKKAINK